MRALSYNNAPAVLLAELQPICRYYGIPDEQVLSACDPVLEHFENYCELVFGADSFELITAGQGRVFREDVIRAAQALKLDDQITGFFSNCSEQFPEAITGIKFCFSADKDLDPTLYVRTKSNKEKVFRFLESIIEAEALSELKDALSKTEVLYGLGFSQKNGSLYLKTYTIADLDTDAGKHMSGFVSLRLHQGKLSREHKEYLPDNQLESYLPSDKNMKRLRDFLLYTMRFKIANHIGTLITDGRAGETKIYIERTGGIPTDFSAR